MAQTKKKSEHYVNNKEFLAAMVEYKKSVNKAKKDKINKPPVPDYIALIRWTNYTADKIVTIPKDKIMTITNASLEMAGNYNHIIQNYDKLDRPKQDETYHKKEFSPEENKKLNEIFREFDDDEEEPPTIH